MFEEARPAAFEREDPEGPTQSDWITIGTREYMVCKVPVRLGGIVMYFGWGGLFQATVGVLFYMRAVRQSSDWAARIYWRKKRWYNTPMHRQLQVEFASIKQAENQVSAFEQTLLSGVVPLG
ncbi:hypothetical protein HL663_18610 [Arthrobacter sp. NEB 688]|nr:hypothetical protein HL663_18610 [Arthrobacter sp. NEB 688]